MPHSHDDPTLPAGFDPALAAFASFGADRPYLPAACRLPRDATRGPDAAAGPGALAVEVTNATPDEPGDELGFDDLAALASAFPAAQRVVLANTARQGPGLGEPLLHDDLLEMIEYLKLRGSFVAVDSNGARLASARPAALAASGLDEYRLTVFGARPETHAHLAGRHAVDLGESLAGLGALAQAAARRGGGLRLVLRCVVVAENLAELPALVRQAGALGATEVYFQRYVYSMAPDRAAPRRSHTAIFGRTVAQVEEVLSECEALSVELGMALRAAGGCDPRTGLAAAATAAAAPWRGCTRPWTGFYVAANGDCLPCHTARQARASDASVVLGSLRRDGSEPRAGRGPEQPAAIWNGPLYRAWRAALLTGTPHPACRGCGVLWSL